VLKPLRRRDTGHRIKYAKVDADTGEEVDNEDIVKGYKVDTDTFIEVTKEELETIQGKKGAKETTAKKPASRQRKSA
jgi:non-homologous end joining protein Ku